MSVVTMVPDNLIKMMIFILIGILLSSVMTASAIEVTGTSTETNTVTGGSTATYTYTAPSSGGGGGGGGGGLSDENFTNIELNEKYYLYIYKDKVTSYRFTSNSNPVLFINITGNTNPGEIRASVEVLRDSSTLIKETAPGTVYKNINIWVGTSGFAVPKNIKEAVIRFKVENMWISRNGFSQSDIKMYKWDGNSWFMLETDAKGTDDRYSYFESKTNSFSSFAISGIESTYFPIVSKPTESLTVMPETGQESATTQAEKSPGFEVAIMIISLYAVYLSWRRK